jgi:hypothetical protein
MGRALAKPIALLRSPVIGFASVSRSDAMLRTHPLQIANDFRPIRDVRFRFAQPFHTTHTTGMSRERIERGAAAPPHRNDRPKETVQ